MAKIQISRFSEMNHLIIVHGPPPFSFLNIMGEQMTKTSEKTMKKIFFLSSFCRTKRPTFAEKFPWANLVEWHRFSVFFSCGWSSFCPWVWPDSSIYSLWHLVMTKSNDFLLFVGSILNFRKKNMYTIFLSVSLNLNKFWIFLWYWNLLKFWKKEAFFS